MVASSAQVRIAVTFIADYILRTKDPDLFNSPHCSRAQRITTVSLTFSYHFFALTGLSVLDLLDEIEDTDPVGDGVRSELSLSDGGGTRRGAGRFEANGVRVSSFASPGVRLAGGGAAASM
jgi:hypothetical protein